MNFTQRRISRLDCAALILLPLTLGLYSLLLLEKAHELPGQSGVCGIYCVMAKNYFSWFAEGQFDTYYFSKSLGSFIVATAFHIFDIPTNNLAINYSLEILSIAALISAMVFWVLTMRHFEVVRWKVWLSAILIFFTFPFVKDLPFVQESPDTLAFALGAAFVYFYASKRLISAFIVFSLAHFVQPQFSLIIMPMLVFWRDGTCHARVEVPQFIVAVAGRFQRNLLTFPNSWTGQFFLIFGFYCVVFSLSAYVIPLYLPPYHTTDNALSYLFPFSILCAAALLATALMQLNILPVVRECLVRLLDKDVIWRLVWVLIIKLAVAALVLIVAHGPARAPTGLFGLTWQIYTFHFHAIEHPLKSWVAHIAYFGPIVFLVIIYWHRLLEVIRQYQLGVGTVVSIALVLALSTDSESRHLIAFLPVIAFMIVLSIGQLGWATITVLLALCLISTRFFISRAALEFQEDWAVMAMGPWWTVEIYVQALSFSLGAAILVALAMRLDEVNRRSLG